MNWNGPHPPSVGYQNGCRCDGCKEWKHRMNRRRRVRERAKRLALRRPKVESMPWTQRSATSFYRDALDAINDRFV